MLSWERQTQPKLICGFLFPIKCILLSRESLNNFARLLQARNIVDDPLLFNELDVSALELKFQLADLTINIGQRLELQLVPDVPDFVGLRDTVEISPRDSAFRRYVFRTFRLIEFPTSLS